MIRKFFTACMLFAICSTTASAQFLIFWDKDEGNWNDSSNWFEEFGPPEAALGDVGVVSNGGIAFLNTESDAVAGGIVLGERAGEAGTLQIRNGGEIVVADDDNVNGSVLVGQVGVGNLVVNRGGSLEAESLRVGGGALSSLVLGGDGSGQAEIKINGPAILGRTTHVLGSSVSFEADSLNLSGGTLVFGIPGDQSSTFDVNGSATLGGVLDLQFDSTPTIGQSWDLIDADFISGRFQEINTNVSLSPGLSFNVSTVEGGRNGMLAQLGIEARLQLSVDRRTGASHIQNLTDSQNVAINGYGVGSSSGLINDGNWKQLSPGDEWAGNSSSTHVAEISVNGSRDIAPGTNIDLGNVYGFESASLGESNEDVFFEYHVKDGDVVQGLIDFTGAHNDVVLVVDEDGAYIQNQSTTDLTINGYAIVSRDGGLDPSSWTSLSEGDNDWRESNPANNHLTELNPTTSLTLPATGQPIPLGDIVMDGTSDLEFIVNLVESGPHNGTVEYDDGVIEFGEGLFGDCNSDGALTAADLECITDIPQRDAVLGALDTLAGDLDGNGSVDFGDFLKLSTNFGDDGGYVDGNIDLSNPIGFPDFLVLSTNFGKTPGGAAAAAVPEPTHLAWLLCSLLLFVRRKRR